MQVQCRLMPMKLRKRRDDISICGYLKDINTREEMN